MQHLSTLLWSPWLSTFIKNPSSVQPYFQHFLHPLCDITVNICQHSTFLSTLTTIHFQFDIQHLSKLLQSTFQHLSKTFPLYVQPHFQHKCPYSFTQYHFQQSSTPLIFNINCKHCFVYQLPISCLISNTCLHSFVKQDLWQLSTPFIFYINCKHSFVHQLPTSFLPLL